MDKLKMHSRDNVAAHIEAVGRLFPHALTEVLRDGKLVQAIDFDVLRQELAREIVEGREERYAFTWPDKRQAILAANAPIAMALRPVVEDSVGRDGTAGAFDSENLYIEGDNLDVLKLLQETYLGKVKMIYIDPPYNTGNDFVYNDDFAQSAEEYMEISGGYDDMGNRMEKNSDTNGRFHTDWLNMIYPRLKVAKSLLSDDGVIFISIDDNEVYNLKKICDEVFGSMHFIAQITLLCNPKGRSQDKYVANCHEYILVYSKNILASGSLSIPKSQSEVEKDYPIVDDDNKPYRELELRNTHREFGKFNRPKLWYPLYVNIDGTVGLETKEGTIEVYPIWDDGFQGCWTWGREKAAKEQHLLVGKKVSGKTKIYRKAYAHEDGMIPLKQVKSIWNNNMFYTERGQSIIGELFETKEKLFQSPKSLSMLKQCIQMAQDKDSLILDFFSGSATTAHAVMQLNAEDGGSRKFIMVQLPETTDEGGTAYKAGYRNICEIGKERIRRAGAKIAAAAGEKAAGLDLGFRCLRLDTSNMTDVYYAPDAVTQDGLFAQVDNVKADRTPEDLLFQTMLDLGILLSASITVEEIAGKRVFNVADGFLLACFDRDVADETVTAIAKRKPYYAVFRDASMADDSALTNFDQLFAAYSPATVRKVL